MAIEIIVPTLGESVSDATVARWMKASGDNVAADEPIVELETDKVTLEVPSPVAGQLGDIVAAEGAVVEVGAILAHLEEGAGAAPVKAPEKVSEKSQAKATEKSQEKTPERAPAKVSEQPSAPDPATNMPAATTGGDHLSPAVRRLVAEHNIDPARLTGTGVGGRLTKADVLNAVNKPRSAPSVPDLPATPRRAPSRDVDAAREERVPMSKLRKIIASRLKSAQNNAAMLTTFNEVDMTALMQLRTDFKDAFEMAHEIRLGFMGVFVQAAIQALREFPAVNAEIDGADIIYKNYYNIGVAVGTPQGLVVPVIKDAGAMDLAATEQAIADFGARAREGKIAPDEMAGGSFTISNGGVYGSLMSTPILNPPQSAILGMHKIDKRPVVFDDQIVIRPMMYLALSYDHRIIDGREAVSFLKRIKDVVEDPRRLLLGV
ncbi:2-oxoglutarate dehydrogenase complex dihydrolipoyllysine-residue succinyltransferase [Alphaproteobacteria bacterium]|nr:2-oxoglutarate dehydrogenase complex dihydrolipoyllysine-residue succinyltransferase [Alphaproteobacteria bacterium]